MRTVAHVIIQLVISLFVVGLILPAVLVSVPSVRDSGAGPLLAVAATGIVFLLIRFVWPRAKNG
jgi:hypothetical protein